MDFDSLVALLPESDEAAGIEGFETRAGYVLPADYRNFLARRNGGLLAGTVEARWLSSLYRGGYGVVQVERFFSMGGDEAGEVRSIGIELADMEHDPAGIPDGIFAIGADVFGNLVTIDLRAASYGQVAVVDHEVIGESFPDAESYQIVAGSFSEFVSLLRRSEDC